MFNAGLFPKITPPAPVIGEALLTAATGTWTAPAGVTSVCAVLVGKGGNGSQYPAFGRGSGGGGALTYGNDIQVTPGDTYQFSIDTNATQIFGMRAPAGVPGTTSTVGSGGEADMSGPAIASFRGGSGRNPATVNATVQGGGAGKYDGVGDWASGIGSQLYGIGVNSGSQYGAGGASVYSGSAPIGQPGAIRIIWGLGRSFPNNAA